VAVAIARGQVAIAQRRIRRGLVQENVELRLGLGAFDANGIGRHRGDADALAHRVGDFMVDQAAVEQIAQHGGNTGDGQGVAHEAAF